MTPKRSVRAPRPSVRRQAHAVRDLLGFVGRSRRRARPVLRRGRLPVSLGARAMYRSRCSRAVPGPLLFSQSHDPTDRLHRIQRAQARILAGYYDLPEIRARIVKAVMESLWVG